MPFVISDTIDAAAVSETLAKLKGQLELGHSIECAAEQAAEFLAAQVRDYPIEVQS